MAGWYQRYLLHQTRLPGSWPQLRCAQEATGLPHSIRLHIITPVHQDSWFPTANCTKRAICVWRFKAWCRQQPALKSPSLRPSTLQVAQDPLPWPADIHHPNTHLSASTSTSAPTETSLCILRFCHKKGWRYRHGNWQRHHNSSGASGPAVTETQGKDPANSQQGSLCRPITAGHALSPGKLKPFCSS